MFRPTPPRLRGAALWTLAGLALAGCESNEIAGPAPDLEPSFSTAAEFGREVLVCHVNDDGKTATFSAATDPADIGVFFSPVGVTGSPDGSPNIDLCQRIWVSDEPSESADLTIAMQSQADLSVYQIVVFGTETVTIDNPATASVTIPVNYTQGAVVFFKTSTVTPPPPPPVTKEGCSVAFWKDPANYEHWPRWYSPNLKFKYAFGLNPFGYKTLAQVLSLQGGGINAVGREAVAALLNAASSDINFYFRPAHVIIAFWYAAITHRYDKTAAVLERINSRHCPL